MTKADATDRPLGLAAATALLVGEVIGIGIFLTPAEMARDLASPGLVYAMWLLAGLMAATGALCFAELASRYPEAGGPYVYLREAFGETLAFLYGWKCLLVLDPGLTAALATGFAQYAAALVPMGPLAQRGLAVATILVVAGLTARGTQLASNTLVVVTALKLGALLAIVGFGLLAPDLSSERLWPTFERAPTAGPLLGALAGGFVAAFFSFGGWWDAAKMAGEVRDPARTLPLAFLSGVGIVTLVYMMTSAVFMGTLPLDQAGSGGAFAAQLGERLFGAAGGSVLSVAVLFCVLGSHLAFALASPRVYVAMARNGLFPERLARPHPRFGTPLGAIAVQATLAVLLVLLGSFETIIAYFIFVAVAFVALCVVGMLRLKAAPGFRTPLRPITAGIFLTLSVLLLLLLAAGRPREAGLGMAVVALGVPVHRMLRKKAYP